MANKKPLVLTRSVEKKLYEKFLVLTLAYFMELGAFAKTDAEERPEYHLTAEGEKVYHTDVEKLASAYGDLSDWLNAINEHLISLNLVRNIIEERINGKTYS